MTAILSVQSLTKKFGGLVAVNDITLSIQEGEIYGIVGPNGAGKTTLFNLIAGNIKPSGGTIEAFGLRVDRLLAHKRSWLGLGRTFHSAQLFHTHTVTASLLSARTAGRRGVKGWLATGRSAADLQATAELLEFLGLAHTAHRLPSELTNLEQQQLAIGMAMATGAKLLLLDEPSGGLIDNEVLDLMAFIGRIRDRGITIVMIDHKMRLMMQLCDRIMVMTTGTQLAEGSPQEIATDERVQDAYLGRVKRPTVDNVEA